MIKYNDIVIVPHGLVGSEGQIFLFKVRVFLARKSFGYSKKVICTMQIYIHAATRYLIDELTMV